MRAPSHADWFWPFWHPMQFGRHPGQIDRLIDRTDSFAQKLAPVAHFLPEADTSPLEVSMSGTADAVGDRTRAFLESEAVIKDYDGFSVAAGTMSARASASGGPAFADTDLSVDIAGADLVIETHRTVDGANFARERLSFIAFDFDFIDLSDDPIEFTFERHIERDKIWKVGEGNLAFVDFDVEVLGDNTELEVETELLAIADEYSGSSIDVDTFLT